MFQLTILHARNVSRARKDNFICVKHAYDYWNLQPEIHPHFHGTFSTNYYIHLNHYFYRIPDNVSDAARADCELSQVYFGLVQANVTYGQYVVIQGAGGLGLNAAAVAKEKGVTVIVVDGVQKRLEKAKQFGADHVINLSDFETLEERKKVILELTEGVGAHVVMELVGVPAAFSEGIHYIRPGGKYVSIENITPGRLVEFDPGLLTRKSIQIIPVVRYNPWYLRKSLEFLKYQWEISF